MRLLTRNEIIKRGCWYCMEHKRAKFDHDCKQEKFLHTCAHQNCPYRELDKYRTYADYMRHHKDTWAEELVSSVYELRRKL